MIQDLAPLPASERLMNNRPNVDQTLILYKQTSEGSCKNQVSREDIGVSELPVGNDTDEWSSEALVVALVGLKIMSPSHSIKTRSFIWWSELFLVSLKEVAMKHARSTKQTRWENLFVLEFV